MSALAVKPLPTPVAKLRNILFATDFSDASMLALPYATAIARKLHASLHLCHIVTPNALAVTAPEIAPRLYEQMQEEAAAHLKGLVKSRELAGLDAKTMVDAGMIEDQLEYRVRSNQIGLIVAGTHGRTGFRKLLIGSAVEAICRTAICPVLTVGPGLDQPRTLEFGRILFPTDLSEDSKQILPYLRHIAEEYQSKVTVLHVMPEELATNPEKVELADPIRRAMIHSFESELAGLNVEFLIDFGETVETVLRAAKAGKADLIAMGIHNSFLPSAHLKSSTAYRIIAAAHCPVLTYRGEEAQP